MAQGQTARGVMGVGEDGWGGGGDGGGEQLRATEEADISSRQ